MSRNRWKDAPDGQGYLQRISEISGGRPLPDLDRYRGELEAIHETALSKAERT